MSDENNKNNMKIPGYVHAFRELLVTELRFMEQMQKLATSKTYFKMLLPVNSNNYKALTRLIKRADVLCKRGSPLLKLLGNPPSTPEAVITTETFIKKISELHQIICLDDTQSFNTEFQPKLTLMAARYEKNISLIKKIKPTILERKSNPICFDAKAASFFNSQCPITFLESGNIAPAQRQTRYPMMLKEILKTIPEAEVQARTQIEALVIVTEGFAKKTEQLLESFAKKPPTNSLSDNKFEAFTSPQLKKQYLSILARSDSPYTKKIVKKILPSSPSGVKADTLELIANLLRLNDYYTNSRLARLQKFPRNSNQRWKTQVEELATLGAKSHLQIINEELSDEEILDIKNTLLQQMKTTQNSIHQKWFYGRNSRLAKTLLELRDYYTQPFEGERKPYDQTKKFPAQIFFFASFIVDIQQKLSIARDYTDRHIVGRTASSFINYEHYITTNFWRKLFPTQKQKVEASKKLIGSAGKLTGWMKQPPLALTNQPLETTLKQAIALPASDEKSPFFKGKYRKAYQKSDDYLQQITPTRGNGIENN